MARMRTVLACQQAADADLLAFAFRTDGPVFRMGYDSHVRAWKRAMGHELWVRYHARPDFTAAYDTMQRGVRSLPLPAWGAAA